MAKRIKPSSLKRISKINPTTPSADNITLRFSFKHLVFNNHKFSIQDRDGQYFYKVLERLKSLSTITVQEFLCNRTNALRAHPINWDETSEKEGFCHLNSQLQDIPAYQFQISSNEHGRLHGLIIDNVFFIIWFDPNHKLYP